MEVGLNRTIRVESQSKSEAIAIGIWGTRGTWQIRVTICWGAEIRILTAPLFCQRLPSRTALLLPVPRAWRTKLEVNGGQSSHPRQWPFYIALYVHAVHERKLKRASWKIIMNQLSTIPRHSRLHWHRLSTYSSSPFHPTCNSHQPVSQHFYLPIIHALPLTH